MQLSHTRPVTSAAFDDPNLVSAASLIPLVKLAQHAGLTDLAQERLTLPKDKGANAGLKVTSLVAGMDSDPNYTVNCEEPVCHIHLDDRTRPIVGVTRELGADTIPYVKGPDPAKPQSSN